MPNHVHLLVTPASIGAISRMRQSVGRRYVGSFNARYRRTGILWEGRFKAALVDTDRYLLNAMYLQSLSAVHHLDAKQGRTPDDRSDNLAAGLAVAAHGNGMSQVDHVVLSDDACRAYAVQGDINSLFKRYTDVNVAQAIATPVAQSSAQWQRDVQQLGPTQALPPVQKMQCPQVDQPVAQLSP